MIEISGEVRRELEQIVQCTPLASNAGYDLFAAEKVFGNGAFLWLRQGWDFSSGFKPIGMMLPVRIADRWGYLCRMEVARQALVQDLVPPPGT